MARTDRASLLIHVPRAVVFAAMLDAEALRIWLPPKGMRGQFEYFDMREGGSYRLVLTYEDTAIAHGKASTDSDVTDVRIVRIVRNELIAQEVAFESEDPVFQGTMRMDWMLEDADGGTEVKIVAREVPAGISAADHAAGISSTLANLSALLESESASATSICPSHRTLRQVSTQEFER